MSLERFCRKPIITVLANQSLEEAAQLMRNRHVGALLIVDSDRPIGIVTDRDIVLRAVADGRDPKTTYVREVMSRKLTVVRDDQKIDDAVMAIRTAGVRRVPIVDSERKVVGMVAIDDLMVLMAGELSAAAAAVQSNRGP